MKFRKQQTDRVPKFLVPLFEIESLTTLTKFSVASPQRSFGVRLSRIHFSSSIRDKRTPKDVCGEATFSVNVIKRNITASNTAVRPPLTATSPQRLLYEGHFFGAESPSIDFF